MEVRQVRQALQVVQVYKKNIMSTIKIFKFAKDDLSLTSEIDIGLAGLSNTTGMTISHYADSEKSSEVIISFDFEGMEQHTPFIEDVDFVIAVRKKIDLTATGPNEKTVKDIGEDVGKYKYVDKVPKRPLDLPPGFQELYKQ